jgi:acyl-CoA thioester hydrolase
MIHQQRVIFGDTDQMGVVYYANYMRYFEASRAAYLRQIGKSGRWLDEVGVGFPVIEAHCRYRKPAHYEDLLDVEVWVSELRSVSLRFDYLVRRDDVVLTEGFTRHACIGEGGRLCRIPDELRSLIENDQESKVRQGGT